VNVVVFKRGIIMRIRLGQYDELCTYVRKQAKARGTIVIVLNGDRGDGFSSQVPLETTFKLADLLETVAKETRASLEGPETLRLRERSNGPH
jgi:hypothetical protein